jgi:Mn-dependent DtxR family transcriptional regulator
MMIQESGEMYLETILVLSGEKKYVRSVDIARRLGYSKPSVSRAMKNLKEEGYIDIDENGHIFLLEKGRAVAARIYERHEVLTKCLISLDVDPKIAEEDACRIEHIISDETFERIREYTDSIH